MSETHGDRTIQRERKPEAGKHRKTETQRGSEDRAEAVRDKVDSKAEDRETERQTQKEERDRE